MIPQKGQVTGVFASLERGLPRPMQQHIELLVGHGVLGDRKSGKRPMRQVLLVGQSTYDLLAAQGIKLGAGALGENLLLLLDVMALPTGSRLYVGTAVLETTQACSPCAHLYQVYPQLKGLMAGRRGMLAQVALGGIVRPGDTVTVILNP